MWKMQSVETITDGYRTLAVIVGNGYHPDGIRVFTSNELSQQLAYMQHPAGRLIQPHVHNSIAREVKFTQEVLFIKRGVLRVDFYDRTEAYLESRILEQGDVILL